MEFSEIVIITYMVHLSVGQDTAPVVSTPAVKIRGISMLYGSESTVQFRNVPYAEPPVGHLRFRKPQSLASWSGTLDGSRFGPSCIHDMSYEEGLVVDNWNMSEDCLSLNIYVPRRLPNHTEPTKSVMIWVHGGGYIVGLAEMFDGSALALKGDVIVVTISYRLGILGFLSTEDDAAKGNYGLWDQRLAFKWVKDNIASFGGDPNSITIFGESAGGFSVALHSLAPINRGLFSRVIAQSGVSNSHQAISFRSLYFAKQYGKLLGCTNSTENVNTSSLVECMRHKSTDDILAAQNSSVVIPTDHYDFGETVGPVIDGELIMDLPSNSFKDDKSESFKFFRSLDFMTGICNSEGTIGFYNLNILSKKMNFNFSLGVPTSVICNIVIDGLVHELYPKNPLHSFLSNAVCNEYKIADIVQQARRFTDMYGDAFFAAPAAVTLAAHAKANNISRTYEYLFNRQNPFEKLYPMPSWFRGASHASELFFLFGFNNLGSDYNIITTPVDREVSETMLSYWTNFAKTGDPNHAGIAVWPSYSEDSKKYINLDSNITAKSHLYNDRVIFWTKTLPTIAQP